MFQFVESVLDQGFDVIIDIITQRGLSAKQLAAFQRKARIVNVHVTAHDSVERFVRRYIKHPDDEWPEWLVNHLPTIESITPVTRKPLDIMKPEVLIMVQNELEFVPSAEKVARQIKKIV